MASSQPAQNHPINREEGQPPSEGGGGNHQQQNPAPAYPPATGYPPTMGYPAYQYNYNPNYYGPPQQVPKPQRISGLFRGIIGGLIFFFLFACILSIITWLILHPVIPIFHVNYLAVSDFNVSSSPNYLTANWVANISARNPNEKLVIDFDEIDAYMIYDGEYLLATSTAKPFAMNTKENVTTVVKLSAANNRSEDSDNLERQEMEKLATERNSGKLTFELRMMLWGTFKSGNWWVRHVLIKVFCENLQIGFLNKNSTDGTLANANSLPDCLVTA